MVAKNECRCNCGYSCNRQCGLPIMECIDKHYKQDCGHIWDGAVDEGDNFASATCSRCGMSAISHDMARGV